MRPIVIKHGRKATDALNAEEKSQMKSVAGSLSWITRQCRPTLAYRTSKAQSSSAKGMVRDLKEANKTIDYAIRTADKGLYFKSGILDWDNMVLGCVSDASHGNETEHVGGKAEPHRSQGGRLQILATPEPESGEDVHFHVVGIASHILKRVCRATIQAEAYALQACVENGDRIRAAIADLRGELDPKDWEATAARTMKQIWLTDCMSVYQSLTRSTMAKMSDKRLSIEIASLRQSLWRKPGEAQGDDRTMDDVPKDTTDKCRWIDTDIMLADPLTKVMEPWKLDEALETNYWSLKQPIDSIMKKRAKQIQRRKTKDDMATIPEEEEVDHANDYHVVQEEVLDEEELITEQNYQHADYSNRGTSSVFMNLYEVQDVQRDSSLKFGSSRRVRGAMPCKIQG